MGNCGEVLKAIERYRKLSDEELDDRFVLYEFMRFRRGYDADYLDFNVEQTLSNWKSAALDLGTPEDFFSTDLSEAYKKAVDKKTQPTEEPSPGETKPVEAPEGQVGGQIPSGNRPPPLENPGR